MESRGGGHSQVGTEKGSSKESLGTVRTSILHCLRAECKFCPGTPGGHLISGPYLVQGQLSNLPGQEAEAGSAASICVQWCVALFLEEDQVEILQNSKWIGLARGKLKLKECERLGSSWEMVKSSAFQRARSLLQLWVLLQWLRMPKAQLFLCSLQGMSSQDFKAFTVSQ